MSPHRARLGLATALLLWLGAAPPAGAHPGAPPVQRLAAGRPAPSLDCHDSYRDVRRQGRSCRVAGGLWKVRLSDGSTVLTHGADPPATPMRRRPRSASSTSSAPTSSRAGPCATRRTASAP